MLYKLSWFSHRCFSRSFYLKGKLRCFATDLSNTISSTLLCKFLYMYLPKFTEYNLWDMKTKNTEMGGNDPFCFQSCIVLLFSWGLRPKWHSPVRYIEVIWMRTKTGLSQEGPWHTAQPFIFKTLSEPARTIQDLMLNYSAFLCWLLPTPVGEEFMCELSKTTASKPRKCSMVVMKDNRKVNNKTSVSGVCLKSARERAVKQMGPPA